MAIGPHGTHATSGGRVPQVLVIDDSYAVRTIVTYILERENMVAQSFAEGTRAISALMNGEIPVPDLILLDIGLPMMDGYDVAKVLRSHHRLEHTPIVMLTGHKGVVDRARSKMIGAAGFISKPFTSAQLREQVRAHLYGPRAGQSFEGDF